MSGFADRFSPGQRAALDALGYRILERHDAAARPGDTGDAIARGADDDAIASRAHAMPAVILIDGIDSAPALVQGIERTARARSAPVRRDGGRLHIETGGDGPDWVLPLDALRASPRHKAALWRALRAVRGTGGPA